MAINNASRVKNTLLNMRINMIAYFISIVISFFTRKIFLDQLGPEFIGLTTTLNSFLGFLSLAELGVGTSIAYFLYKPLFDHDEEKINETISIMGYLYRIIGLIILAMGIVLSLFFPVIFSKAELPWWAIYYCFYAQLFCSLIGYFVNYKANTIFSADQRYYLVTGYFQATQFAMTLVQMIVALYTGSYFIYITITIVFTLINTWILNWKFNRLYPWVKASCKFGKQALKTRPEIMKYVRRTFIHQIGGFINSNATPLILYGYTSLTMVTMYGNYSLLNGKVSNFIGSALAGSNASVGNLIAEGDKVKTFNCYKELFSVKFFVVVLCSLALIRLNSSFINVWLGNQYVFETLLSTLIVISFCLNLLRDTTQQFLSGFGLVADVWVPICRVVSILFVVIAGHFWGLVGILIVPIIIQLTLMHIWKPYYLFRDGLKIEFKYYWLLLVYNSVPFIIGYILSHFISVMAGYGTDLSTTWGEFIKESVLFVTPLFLISASVSWYMPEGIRPFLMRMTSLIGNWFNRKYGKN